MRNNGWSVAYMDGVYLWVVSSYLLFNDLWMEKYGIFEHYYTKLFFLSFLFLHLERLCSTQNQSVACLLSVLFHFCYSESEMLEFYSRDFNYAEEFPSQCFMSYIVHPLSATVVRDLWIWRCQSDNKALLMRFESGDYKRNLL